MTRRRATGSVHWTACPPSVSVETSRLNEHVYAIAGVSTATTLPTEAATVSSASSSSASSACFCSRTAHTNLCYQFYRYGAAGGVVTSIASVCLLVYTVLGSLFMSSDIRHASAKTAAVLTPLVPGVNIPPSHLFYVFFGYSVSTFIHELGHAIALATHDYSRCLC